MLKSHHLILVTAVFLISFGNHRFFSNIIKEYPFSIENIGFLISLALVFSGVTVLLLSLFCYRHTIKPLIIGLLMVSAFAAYFMDSYNAVLDSAMITNAVNTDVAETLDLLSFKLLLYVLFLGVLPSFAIYKAKLTFASRWQEIFSRIKLVGAVTLGIAAALFVYSDFYSSFLREHKSLRLYSNPNYYVYSAGKFLTDQLEQGSLPFKARGQDAHIPEVDKDRELIIFVVGETARADHFSLNGYERETNPLLKQEALVSFSNFWSCGTSTAISVPCMFSHLTTEEFNKNQALATENALDILAHGDANVLWLDNNSDSKGVAVRVPYENYKSSEINPICDTECRDVGMLSKLQEYIDAQKQGDIVIVLHQFGQHGPAYYKRYPAEFEKFTPVCKTNQLEDCSAEELNNAYDNAILYTDYFLSKTIALLKQNNAEFETAMFYASDHGESLGENGLYLHGLPNLIAPDAQRHVPAIIWLGETYEHAGMAALLEKRDRKFSHDNIFHTLLGFFEIISGEYDETLDILRN
ncbi:MAG: phosphoethanolamine--lipid A transferase [Rhodobacteraceae bacterium]|nr:phosphoethanolamine--lipid A transferase [Paracoccaceae bacterium]